METPNDPNERTEPGCCGFIDDCIREKPLYTVLAALGVGIVVALIVRALRPSPPPRTHVKHLLEDIRDRLEDLTDPALHKLGKLADEGSAVLKRGASRADGIVHRLRSLSCKVGDLFQ
jgi:ElaB/YqjD/DUF883 family membrane-anchored ribosome-binding protein